MSRSLWITLLLLAPGLLRADPPARAVRLNVVEQTVSFRPAGIEEWTNATVNRPLVNGDELWTEPSARAELHIGSAAVRLGSTTLVTVVNETDRIAQLRLASGSLNVRVRRVGEKDTWEIDTPNASVSLLKPGRYRIEVTSDGLTTTVVARHGEAEVTGSDSAFPVRSGEEGSISGTSNQAHEVAPAPPLDDFDRWANGRDQREDKLAMTHNFSRDLLGYEDLDASGTWRFTPEYGWVWTPTAIAAGWAPYRYGHWTWIDPWGWTWIDDTPWGFAPFHYGRWAYTGGAWIWVPGNIVRPVYAPALVAFGGGAGWRASISAGAVAWWPLAPGEAFVPAYAVAPAYVRTMNAPVAAVQVTGTVSSPAQYANRAVAGAVTAVPNDSFATAKPVAASTIPLTAAQTAAATPIGTAPQIAPRPESVTGAAVSAARPPAQVASRPVLAKTPPPPPPIPFAAKASALAQHPGRPLDQTTERKLRASGAVPSSNPLVKSSVSPAGTAAGGPKPSGTNAPKKPSNAPRPKGHGSKPRKS